MKPHSFVTLCLSLAVLCAQAQVTISNAATSGMVFIGTTWQPTAPVANLNIADLLVTLAGSDVTVQDFTPTVCVGPLIVEDPIIYNLGTALTLSSCQNLMIYDVVENQGAGSLFLSSTGPSPGTGYLVVGTGVGQIPALTKGGYGMPAAPLPDTSKAVHVGSLGGLTSLSAAILIAVVSDAASGEYAQVGLPRDLTTGAILAFSGQSIAIGSGVQNGCYARIGHGDATVIPPTGGQIDVINENGNLYIQSFSTFPGTYAAVGHMTGSGPLSGAINVTIEGNPGSGNIWIEGGGSSDARIGHQTINNALQDVSGSITVQCRGVLDIQGGTCADCHAEIGHRSASDALVTGQITVECGTGATLTGGSSSAAARVGHAATMIGITPLDAVISCAVEGDAALLGGSDGPAAVGHHVLTGAAQQAIGDMYLYVHSDLNVSGGPGSSSTATIGHGQAAGALAVATGTINCFTGGQLVVTAGSHSSATGIMGHTAHTISGAVDIMSGGSVVCTAGLAESRIDAQDQVSISSGDSILVTGGSTAAARIRSFAQDVDLQAMHAVVQQAVTTGMTSIEPTTQLTISAGADITLEESFFPQNGVVLQLVQLDADRNFLGGDLWSPPGYFSFFLPNLFLAPPLAGPSPVAPDDGAGTFKSPNTSFLPASDVVTILSSCNDAEFGMPSTLEIGSGLTLDPTMITSVLLIGDMAVAPDTSAAIRQSFYDVMMHDVIFGMDSVFIKACHDLHVWNTTLTTSGSITLVADNTFPASPIWGTGVFTSDNVQMTTGPASVIRVYSASQAQNMAAGGVTNTILNGVAHVSCSSSCTYETWSTYYNNGTVTPGSYQLFYKSSPVLAHRLEAFDIACSGSFLLVSYVIEGMAGRYDFAAETWLEGQWQVFHEFDDILGPTRIMSGEARIPLPGGTMVRLQITDPVGEITYSRLMPAPCYDGTTLTIGPNPTRATLRVQSDGGTFDLFDPFGTPVLSDIVLEPGVHEMDLADLPSGLYSYRITGSPGQAQSGIVVKTE
ncbi:MAG: hypothetical protein R3301_08660 [Saprospiraceae bacterium]|nr:hypothetical protein [Saprospiraceae bacterium]